MLEYNFIVPGEPIPDARPRVLRSGHLESNTFYLSAAPLDRKLYVQVNEVLESEAHIRNPVFSSVAGR